MGLTPSSSFARIECTAAYSVRTDRFVTWDGAVVTGFDERTAHEVIRAVHPDIYAKGGDYRAPEEVSEFALLQELGIDLRLLGHIEGVSTTAAIHRMRTREAGTIRG